MTSRIANDHITENNCQFKVVLLGETDVGKSCLVNRYVKDQFRGFLLNTVGAAYFTKTVQMNNFTIKLEIWDTAGQERYHVLAPMYYRRTQAAIIVYDITNYVTFEKAKKWIEELQNQVSVTVTMLVGNKLDLNTNRCVHFNEAKKFADENNLLYMETSAKTSVNVTNVFETIARKLSYIEKTDSKTNLHIIDSGNKRKKNCCT